MALPLATVPVLGSVAALAATSLPVLLHHREPDVVNLAVGLAFLVAGAQLIVLRSTRATANLLVAASLAWFLPDLAPDVPLVGDALAEISLVHVPVFVAALLVAPAGRLQHRRDVLTVAFAALAGASAVTGGYQVLLPLTGAAVLVDGSLLWLGIRQRAPRPAQAYLVAVTATALALVGVPMIRLAAGAGHERSLFVGYGMMLAAAALALVVAGPWLPRWAALDVGPDGLARFDGLLAEVTGDPRAHVAVRVGDGRWLRLDESEDAASHALTAASSTGTAVVVSDVSIPAGLISLVDDGLRLAAANVLARQAVQSHVCELGALRERLVQVDDEESAALVLRIRKGPIAALSRLREGLEAAGVAPTLINQVRQTEEDLTAVAVGLDPLADFPTLGDAIVRLCHETGVPVTLDSPQVDAGPAASRAVWFACSEALANAAKHAPQGGPEVFLGVRGGDVVLIVTDRGPGPGIAKGGGLDGVRDRLAAAGGVLRITGTEPGTRVEIRAPLWSGTRYHVGRTGAGADVPPTRSLLASTPPTTEASA